MFLLVFLIMMDENSSDEAHLIGGLIDSITAESDSDYLAHLRQRPTEWHSRLPPPTPMFVGLQTQNYLYDQQLGESGRNWTSVYTPFGPVRSSENRPPPQVESVAAPPQQAFTTTSRQTGSALSVPLPKGKSYRDVAVSGSRQTQSVSTPPLNTFTSGGGFGHTNPVARCQSDVGAKLEELRSGNSSSAASSIGRESPSDFADTADVFVPMKSSGKYGLETFSDSENRKKEQLANPTKVSETDKIQLVGFISKGGDAALHNGNNHGANAFRKNATTTTVAAGTDKQFQKITRKKSRGETTTSSTTGNSLGKNSTGESVGRVKAPRSNVKAVETSQPPLVAVSTTRFSVLSSVAAAVGFSVKSADHNEAKEQRNTIDGSFLLNNDKRFSGNSFFRSKSATREATYINNDFNAVEDDESSVEGSEEGSKSNLGRFKSDNHHPRSDSGELHTGGRTEVRSSNASSMADNLGKTGGKKFKDGSDNVGRRKRKQSKLGSIIENGCYAAFAWVRAGVYWLIALVLDIASQLLDISIHCTRSTYNKVTNRVQSFCHSTSEGFRELLDNLKRRNWWRNRKIPTGDSFGLDENILLPSTGEEAMARLLACKGQDSYSILGLKSTCSDDEIKHYYKRQAFLVHPDKNSSYGADEAFKVLGRAFELIGTPDKRHAYDMEVHKTKVTKEFDDLLSRLREKMEEALNTMHCDCGNKHRRFKADRSILTARYCKKCKENHCAREGDIWAESRWCGFLWYYYACMDGLVFDITEWAACPKNNLKHMKPNTHVVQYRLITGRNRQQQQQTAGHHTGVPPLNGSHGNSSRSHNDADIEEYLKRFYDEKFSNSARSASSGNPVDFVQSKFNPPPCGHGDMGPKKAGRRRKARN